MPGTISKIQEASVTRAQVNLVASCPGNTPGVSNLSRPSPDIQAGTSPVVSCVDNPRMQNYSATEQVMVGDRDETHGASLGSLQAQGHLAHTEMHPPRTLP